MTAVTPDHTCWTAATYAAVKNLVGYWTVARTVHFIDRRGEEDHITEYLGHYGSGEGARIAAEHDAARYNQAWRGRHANGDTKCC